MKLEFEEILGYHLEQAYTYRAALGSLDDAARDLGRRGSQKLASAGRRAFGRGDAPGAASLLRRASLTLGDLDPDRIELLTELAEAEIEQGRFEAAGVTLDDALRGAVALSDSRLEARQALVRFQVGLVTSGSIGDPDDVAALARQMIPIFEDASDAAGLARTWRLLWVIYGTTGALESAADAASRVVDIGTKSGDSRLAARAAVAYSQAALESPMPVLEAIERCEALIGAVGSDRIGKSRFLAILSVLYAMRGRFDDARTKYARSREIMVDLGPSVTAAGASLESSRVEMLAGDAKAAARELRIDLETLEALDERYYRPSVAGLLAHALYEQALYEEAFHQAEVAESLAGEDDVFSQVIWRTARAKLEAQAGAHDKAVVLAKEAVTMASSGSYIEQHAEALTDLAEVYRVLGARDEQEPPLREALVLFERKGDVVSADRVRARLRALSA